MAEPLDRKINKLFIQISKKIYQNDIAQDDTRSWWPTRPPLLDYPIVEALFKEIIRLLKQADQNGVSTDQQAALFESKELIGELNFLWPSLGFTPTNI